MEKHVVSNEVIQMKIELTKKNYDETTHIIDKIWNVIPTKYYEVEMIVEAKVW